MKKINKIFSAVSNIMQRRSDDFVDATDEKDIQSSEATGITYIRRKTLKIFGTIAYILISAGIYIAIFMLILRPMISHIGVIIDLNPFSIGAMVEILINMVGYFVLYVAIHILVLRPLRKIGAALARL